MQQVPQNRQGRQKTRKKPVLCEEKIVIFLKAFAQAASYFIFYYENTISLDVENLLLPMSCFFLGFFINMILIYRFHNQDAFTCFHIVLISLSLILAIESNSVDYDDSQKQIKMFMVLIYYACILIGRISFGNKHAALMMLMLIIVFTVYQVLLFSKIVDLLFMIAYLLFDSYFIWKYLRLLDVLSNFQKELDSKQYQFQLQQCKENLRIQQQALKYGTSDFIFFTNLQQKEQNKLRFYQINKLFDKKFDIKYMNNIISRMKVNQISVILKIQNKIYKILTEESQDPSSKFEEFIDRISRERYNNIINQQNIGSAAQIINVDGQNQQNNNQQSSENEDDQQQSVQEQDKMVNQRQNRFNFDKRNQQLYKMNGLEDQFWYIDSLKKCIQTIKAHTQDSNYNVQQKQLVKCFNLQEIILVLLYRIRFKYLKKSTTDIVTNLFKTTLSNVEIQHENTFYTANLFKCMYKSEWSLFLSMNKKQSFNTSDTTSNTNTDEATQRLLQFFKNRTEKFSRCITSLLCKFDNIKNFNAEQELSQLSLQFEYLRMIAKDTEEYREYLQEYSSNGRDQVIKMKQCNISQFKFKQLFQEVFNLFSSEVYFKSTSIFLIDEGKKGEQLLITDYEKLKRILILLIENILTYSEAGCIEIELKDENSSLLQIVLKDNSRAISERVIKEVNTKGYTENGYGFAIVTELAKSISLQLERPFQIRPDTDNDKTYYEIKISKNLHEEPHNQTQNNIISQPNYFEPQNDPRENNVSNASNQQFHIDSLIRKNLTQFIDGSQIHGRNPSQPNINSNINSPIKFKSQVDLKTLFNNIQIKLPPPYIYYGIHQKKTNKNTTHENNGSNLNIFDRAGTSNFLQINQNVNTSNNNYGSRQNILTNSNNNPPNPLNSHDKNISIFLIVSGDLRISASLNQILLGICNNKKDLVKHAPNIKKYKDLLKKFQFEFILIDFLMGTQYRELIQLINQYYKNKKKNQKIIFFNYNFSIYRNLEQEIPLMAQNEINVNDTKSDFKLQLPSINNNFVDQNNQNGYHKNGLFEQQSAANHNRIPANEANSQHNIDDLFVFKTNKSDSKQPSHDSHNDESNGSISVPNEPQNYKIQAGQHENDFNTARSVNKNQNDPEITEQSMNILVNKSFNQNNFSGINQTHFNGISNKKNLKAKEHNVRVNFAEEETKNKNEDHKVKKLNRQQIQLSQAPQPHVTGQDSEHNSMRSSTYRGRAITHSPDDRRNSPSNPPISINKQNTGKSSKKLFVKTDLVNKSQEFQQRQVEMHAIRNSQDYIFNNNYNESIEVGQSLKFFYYSIQQPFGYSQIYEAIHHMESIKKISHLDLSYDFFNLNRSYIYYQQMNE